MSILGNRVQRTEDPALLTGAGTYIDDLPSDGALHVTYVRSTVAHAHIQSIDTSDAAAAPGVVAVFTGADVDLEPVAPSAFLNQAMARPMLATDTVRFVGEAVAAILSETKAQGVDAAEMVWPDYDFLPAVVDPEAALAGDVLLFPDAGTNVTLELPADTEPSFDDCEVVVEVRTLNQRVAPCPLEPRAGAARWGDDGRLTVWACTQNPHEVRNSTAEINGLDPEQVRVIVPEVGGGFGAKSGVYPEEAMLPWLAKQAGRPVRWVETRTESMLTLGHGRGQIQDLKLGGTRDGKLLAYELKILQDGGAYGAIGNVLPFMTRLMAPGVYDVPAVSASSTSVVTTTTPTVAYRGAGRPEATAAIERVIDVFAAEIDLDPAEVRRRNFVPVDQFPFQTATGATYDCGDYEGALDRALAAAGYDDLRAEQRRRRDAGDPKLLGIGLSTYVEITNPIRSGEYGSVEITPEGGAVVRTGSSAHGQGHHTVWAMIAHDATGIPMELIEVRHGDTDDIPRGGGTGGSRSLQLGGVAVGQAAEQVVDEARRLAADLLEAAVDDVVLDTDTAAFHVTGTPAVSRSWADIAAAASTDDAVEGGILRSDVDFNPEGSTFPFGAHVAVVEVDRDTGRVELVRHVACDDAGRIMNPLVVDGQVHGGIAQGVAQALIEQFSYDGDGNPITANFADYGIISTTELPMFERIEMETPTPLNPLGAKGIGESGTIGSTPAVQNAVVDALSHLGVRHVDMPFTPERVWQVIRDASGE